MTAGIDGTHLMSPDLMSHGAAGVTLAQPVAGPLRKRGAQSQGQAPVTRQITSPTSSATRREPSGPIETPTGRP